MLHNRSVVGCSLKIKLRIFPVSIPSYASISILSAIFSAISRVAPILRQVLTIFSRSNSCFVPSAFVTKKAKHHQPKFHNLSLRTLNLRPLEQKRIYGHAYGACCHRYSSDLRGENYSDWNKNACCHRDCDNVVACCPNQVFIHLPHSLSTKSHKFSHITRVILYQNDISRLNSHICSRSNSNTDVCLNKCWCIVYAIANHGYSLSLVLQGLHRVCFLVRQDLRKKRVQPQLFCHVSCSLLVVARKHSHLQTFILQPLNRFS